MTPQQIEQVFGRGRLKMATGEHVEVFREAMMPGERRRYTKRFLKTSAGDFGPWTEREWRILARLIGHGIRCVPDVVQFDGGAPGGARLVQTYDAGITVDQWGTLLPVTRRRRQHPHVFEDCAHWWSLAHHCLAALDEIHALGLVHLDIKGDNICIPYGPPDFNPEVPGARVHPEFERLALIDFAFSLVSRESLAMPLPIGWQKDYDYQSPRLLRALDAGRSGDLEPTKALDWRCDLYSLAAMLKRYLPIAGRAHDDASETGWSSQRYDEARTLILRLRDSHDRELSHWRPHSQFLDYTFARLRSPDLASSLADGWALSRDTGATGAATPMTPITPMTRIAPAIRVPQRSSTAIHVAPSTIADAMAQASPRRGVESSRPAQAPRAPATAVTEVIAVRRTRVRHVEPPPAMTRASRRAWQRALPLTIALAALVAIAAPSFIGDPEHPLGFGFHDERNLPPLARTNERGNVVPEAATPPQSPAPATVVAARAADSEPAAAEAASGAVEPPAPPPGQPVAEGPQSQAEATGVASPTDTVAASPESSSEPAPTSGTPIVDAPAPRSHEAGPATSSQAQPGRHVAPSSRAQIPRRSSKATTVKPAERSAKAYADAARRSPSNTGGGPARATAPTPRLNLASVTAAPAFPSSNPQAPSAATGSGADKLRSAVDTPAVPIGTTIDIEPASAAAGVHSSAASSTTVTGGAEPAPTEPRGARAEAVPRQSAPGAKPRNDWRAQLANLFAALRDRTGAPAPVEDRIAQAANDGRVAVPRSLAQPTTGARAHATLYAGGATATPSTQGAAPASSPVTPAPSVTERMPPALPSPATSSGKYGDASDPAPSLAEAGGAAIQAPPAVDVRPVPLADPRPTPRRVATPPRASPEDVQSLATQARRLLTDTVPRIANLAEPEVARVLAAAAVAMRPSQARLVIDAADGPWPSESAWIPVSDATPTYARRLHDQARRTLAAGGDVTEALNVELQAFGANPRDPDIAGYLAYLYLRTTPARPETARQLALHSIVFSRSRRSTRQLEWNVFAVASALTGRELDAVRAFLTEATLTTNVDRSCQAVLSAYTHYGERLRVPAMAFLQRVNEHGRAYGAPSCMRSVYWN